MHILPIAFILSLRGLSKNYCYSNIKRQIVVPLQATSRFRNLNSNPILKQKNKNSKVTDIKFGEPHTTTYDNFDEDDKIYGVI